MQIEFLGIFFVVTEDYCLILPPFSTFLNKTMIYIWIGLLLLYGICLFILCIYGLGLFILAIGFWRNRKKFTETLSPLAGQSLPFVTIQLPIYNEKYVIERLIDAVAAQDYPTDCFEIQVLDDSTDESSAIIARKITELSAKGISLKQISRSTREGYKAGALAASFAGIKGDFVAIFDADFVPRPDFLRKMLPYLLENENIGLVQTRWEHLNENQSLLTRAQAFHLNAHFAIEQFVRNTSGYFMHFNGTAGIWRKACIADAGGWEADTLTEDVDLSYRAQLKGWKMRYVDNIGAPAELPILMSAVKSQQFRWMKGGAEVARKLLRKIGNSEQSFATKFYASHHLLGSSLFIISFIAGLLSLPICVLSILHPEIVSPFMFVSNGLFVSFIFLLFFYFTATFAREGSFSKAIPKFLISYLPFMTFILGLSFHNARAAYLGLRKTSTPFIRTPKFNESIDWQQNSYRIRKASKTSYIEIALCLYFTIGVFICLIYHSYIALPFQLMFAIGYGAVAYFSIRHAR